MSYSDIVATIAMVVSITAVPASGYLSFRYALKGEKRKEFNAVADALRAKIRDQIRIIDEGYYPANGRHGISDSEIDDLCDMSQFTARNEIYQHWSAYKVALAQSGSDNGCGEFVFHNPAPVRRALQILLTFTERR